MQEHKLINYMLSIVQNPPPPFLQGGGGENFNYLPEWGRSEQLKKGGGSMVYGAADTFPI